MKMPKLTFIKFDPTYTYEMNKTENIYERKLYDIR